MADWLRTLSKRDLKLAVKQANKESRAFPRDKMTQIPLPNIGATKSTLLRVYRSRDYLAQIFDETDKQPGLLRLSINKTDVNIDTRRWKDGISWDDLMRVKDQVGMGHYDAVEIYPAERDVVNVANIRHLWVFTESNPLDFIWRN